MFLTIDRFLSSTAIAGRLTCSMKTSQEGIVPMPSPAKSRALRSRKTKPVGVPRRQRFKRIVLLEDSVQPRVKIRCVYFNIDRDLPVFEAGTYLRYY
jgi:hypothetical protein